MILYLPATDKEKALEVANRICKAVQQMSISLNSTQIRLTSSFGVSTLVSGSQLKIPLLIDQADQALYHAKKAGRNRVYVYMFENK